MTIISSAAKIAETIEGGGNLGGLIGYGGNETSLTVIGSYIQSNRIETAGSPASGNAGGLIGSGDKNRIISSYVQVGEIIGTVNATDSMHSRAGGLIGSARNALKIISSYTQAKKIAALHPDMERVAAGGLVGGWEVSVTPEINNSYWQVSNLTNGGNDAGVRRTPAQLSAPTDYADGDGIYATWTNEALSATVVNELEDIKNGLSNFTRWCDTNDNGVIEEGEKTNENRLWDFGGPKNYPALRCALDSARAQRKWFRANRALLGVE